MKPFGRGFALIICTTILACGPERAEPSASTSGTMSSGGSTSTSATTFDTADATDGGTTTSFPETTSTSASSEPQTSSSSTGPTTPDCEARNPEFGCAPIDCSAPPFDGTGCGEHHIFDLDGCMRAWCEVDSSECGDGQICYRPTDCDPSLDEDGDGCYPTEMANCGMTEDRTCECTPLSCTLFGWCIPAQERPC